MTVEEIRAFTWDDISGMTFEQREEIGRTIYDSLTTLAHQFTRISASWDVSATGETNTFNIEIKYRYISREKYDEKGYWLEKTKYDALMDAYNKTGSLPIFITFLKDGIGYCWNLLDLQDLKWGKVLATSSTADGTYAKDKRYKEVCFPFPNQGREIKW